MSLFQCPPRMRLMFGEKPTRKVRLASGPAASTWAAEGAVLAWTSKGSKFVLVGAAAPDTLRRVAGSLP